MTRVGDLEFLSTDGKTPNEKLRERIERDIREGNLEDGEN
jgi:hypothetical protein